MKKIFETLKTINRTVFACIVIAIGIFVVFYKPELKMANVENSSVQTTFKDGQNSVAIDKLLNDSGIFKDDLWSKKNDVIEIDELINKKIKTPSDYEIALEKTYNIKNFKYTVILFRQIKPKKINVVDNVSSMPTKPILFAVVDVNESIKYFAIINKFSVLTGNLGWSDYDKNKISALDFKDLDKNGINEILIRVFKMYTADSEDALFTFYYDERDNKFEYTKDNDYFSETSKKGYELVNINNDYYVLDAEPGSGNCRICPTPYLIHIYKFTHGYYFDIGSVASEKEFETGEEAIKYKMLRIKDKIINHDVFIL